MAYIKDRQEYFEYLRQQRLAQIERNFPDEMKNLPNWAVYKTFKKTDEKIGETKVSKYILDCKTGQWASANDSSTCSSFDDAKSAASRLQARGLSFNLNQSPYTVIDLDGVFVDGQYSQLAQEILNMTGNTLTERSVSGTGLHIFLKGKKDFIMPGYKTKGDGGLEVFDNKFISVTGDLVSSTKTIAEPSFELVELLKQFLGKKAENFGATSRTQPLRQSDDHTVMRRIGRSKVAKEFEELYYRGDTSRYNNDHSRADFRLCGILAFFTYNNFEQSKRLFESSALYRAEKGDDYVNRTVRAAINTNSSGSSK